jgi:hypothetical protein
MNNLKTYEGFFDFFKKSEDDKIALEYIKRLKRIKDISPYDIEFKPGEPNNNYSIEKFTIKFDDTPMSITKVTSLIVGGFLTSTKDMLIDRGFVKKNNSEFYRLAVDCEGEVEELKASASLLKDVFNLCKSVYRKDIESRRIRKINLNINPAADKLDPDIYGDQNN